LHILQFFTKFSSYFILFDGDCRLEIMEMPNLSKSKNDPLKHYTGLAHFAIKVGNKPEVDRLTELIARDGFKVISEPRTTGDGYYESVILDPDGNRVELVA
jgi:lactoylglutathione lyase